MVQNFSQQNNSPLAPSHYAEIVDGSGVSPEIARLNFWTITDPREVDQLLNRNSKNRQKHSDNLVPGWAVAGVDPATGERWVQGAQFKPDAPVEVSGKPQKYLSASGYETQPLFLDTGDSGYWPAVLAIPTTPILITEGAKKAGCLLSLGYAAVSLPGVWNGQRDGRLKDLIKSLCAVERPVYLAFDSDQVTKPGVRAALDRLGRLLTAADCVVSVVTWDATHKGIDDLAVKVGADAVKAAIDGAAKFEEWLKTEEKPSKPSAASTLLEIIEDLTLWHTPDRQAYADIPTSDHLESHSVNSKPFKDWLQYQLFTATGKTAANETMQQVLSVCNAKALYEGAERETYIRVALHQGNIYLDLGRDDWQVVVITPAGWRVITYQDCPVRFRRSKSTLPLPLPELGGRIADLWELLNIAPEDRVLVGAWLTWAFYPIHQHPILVLHGDAGAAKTSASRLLKGLVDPGKAGIRTAPRQMRDLFIRANNGWVQGFDNLSSINEEFSDALCCLATGSGFATRTLTTDTDETLIEGVRPIILNGIEQCATRSDILQRGILVRLTEIPEDKRLTETELTEKVAAATPKLLGSILDVAAAGLLGLTGNKPRELKRMADFHWWGTCVAESLGFTPEQFTTAYSETLDEGVKTALESSPFAQAVLRLMEGRISFTGSSSLLLSALAERTPETVLKSKVWPGTPAALGRAISRVRADLVRVGVKIEVSHTEFGRLYQLETLGKKPSVPSVPSEPNQGELLKPEGYAQNTFSQPSGTFSQPSAGQNPEGSTPNPSVNLQETFSPESQSEQGFQESPEGTEGSEGNLSLSILGSAEISNDWEEDY